MLGSSGWDTSTVHALAGDLVSLNDDALVFRLKGQPGERVVFAFQMRERQADKVSSRLHEKRPTRSSATMRRVVIRSG